MTQETLNLQEIATRLNPDVREDLSDAGYVSDIAKEAERLKSTGNESAQLILLRWLQLYISTIATSKSKKGTALITYNLDQLIQTLKILTKQKKKQDLPDLDGNATDDDDEDVRVMKNPCQGLGAKDCKALDDCSWRYYGRASKRSCGAKPGRFVSVPASSVGSIERRLSKKKTTRLPRCAKLSTKTGCVKDPNCIWNSGTNRCGGRSGTKAHGYKFKFDENGDAVNDGVRRGWTPEDPYGGSWD